MARHELTALELVSRLLRAVNAEKALELCTSAAEILRSRGAKAQEMLRDIPNLEPIAELSSACSRPMSRLSADSLLSIATYLTIPERARFGFMDLTTHQVLVGFPVDLTKRAEIRGIINFDQIAHSLAPRYRAVRFEGATCTCQASRVLRSIGIGSKLLKKRRKKNLL